MPHYMKKASHLNSKINRAEKTFPEFIWLNSTCNSDEIRNSIEYQLKIDHRRFEGNRTSVIEDYISFFASITGLSTRKIMEDSYWNCLEEYEVKTLHTCGHPRHTFRIRNYLSGANETMTSVDVKVNAFDNITWACSQPFRIDPQYKNRDSFAFDKLEHDVHPCEARYSREARIHGLPFRSEFSTCHDFEKLFPDSFDMNDDTRQKVIPEEDRKSTKTWFSWKSEGYLPTAHPIKYIIDFTIRYNNKIEAENGIVLPKPNSEFSFRVFKRAKHLYSDYAPVEGDLMQTYEWYKQMLERFGSFEEYPCGQ